MNALSALHLTESDIANISVSRQFDPSEVASFDSLRGLTLDRLQPLAQRSIPIEDVVACFRMPPSRLERNQRPKERGRHSISKSRTSRGGK